MALDALADRLALLLADGRLPHSVLGPFNRAKLQSLFDAGVLREQRVGGGRRIVVENRPALEAFVRSRYPSGLGSLVDAGAPPKSRAVAERRDAKLARRGDAEPVLLRGFGDAVLRSGDDVLQVAEWTRRAGLAALRVDDPCPWGFEGTVAVVENLEVFLHLERIGVPCDIALYAAGRLSRRVLGWLGSPAMDRCGYIHCGDFDPMGLDEYLRPRPLAQKRGPRGAEGGPPNGPLRRWCGTGDPAAGDLNAGSQREIGLSVFSRDGQTHGDKRRNQSRNISGVGQCLGQLQRLGCIRP
jgi:hypothetical protein